MAQHTTIQRAGSRFLNRISISTEQRLLCIEQLMMLLSAGMDMIHILESIKQDVKSRRLKHVISAMRDDIDSGLPLWQSMENTYLMPAHVISLLRIGEQSGTLADNLRVVAGQQRKDREFRARVRSALLYPVFVLSLTVIIGLAIAWFILPKLTAVFRDLHVPLPLITRILIRIGAFFSEYGNVAVPSVLIGLALSVYIIFLQRHTRVIGQGLLLMLPGIRKLVQEIEISRLGYMLGTLLSAGLPIVEALESVAQSPGFYRYQRFYRDAAQAVSDGQSLRVFFAEYEHIHRLFPATIQQLIVAGEQSGVLPETLLNIGVLFETKIENTTKNLAVILEPVLLVIVWLGVVAVALAVVLPIYSLIGGLNV